MIAIRIWFANLVVLGLGRSCRIRKNLAKGFQSSFASSNGRKSSHLAQIQQKVRHVEELCISMRPHCAHTQRICENHRWKAKFIKAMNTPLNPWHTHLDSFECTNGTEPSSEPSTSPNRIGLKPTCFLSNCRLNGSEAEWIRLIKLPVFFDLTKFGSSDRGIL